MNYSARVKEILKENGLDFTINKYPLMGHNNEDKLITPYFGLFNSKTGECINTAKAGYTVSQNAEVVEMVLKGIQKFSKDLRVGLAGSIHGGRRVFINLELEGVAKLGGDTLKQYITVVDSNDGSTGLSVGIGDEAAHCSNQFFKFYAKGQAKFRHTASLEKKIQTLPHLIETALSENLKQIKTYERFASTPVTEALAHKMVKEILGNDRTMSKAEFDKLGTRSKNMMNTLYANIDREYTEAGKNMWGLFNGVTRFTTHESVVPKRNNGRVESLLIGGGYKKNLTAFNFCLANS